MKHARRDKLLVKFVEIYSNSSSFTSLGEGIQSEEPTLSLREAYINPEHVVCIREDVAIEKKIAESPLSKDLDPRQRFTKVFINRGQSGFDITVVGSLSSIQEKLSGQTKDVLRG